MEASGNLARRNVVDGDVKRLGGVGVDHEVDLPATTESMCHFASGFVLPGLSAIATGDYLDCVRLERGKRGACQNQAGCRDHFHKVTPWTNGCTCCGYTFLVHGVPTDSPCASWRLPRIGIRRAVRQRSEDLDVGHPICPDGTICCIQGQSALFWKRAPCFWWLIT